MQAVALYKQVLQHDPQNLQALNSLAWLVSECQGNPKAALALIDRAFQLHGPSAELLDTRGVILRRLGQLSRAIQDLEEAHANSPKPHIAFHLAQAYQQAGRTNRALEISGTVKDSESTLAQLHWSERASFKHFAAALQSDSGQK